MGQVRVTNSKHPPNIQTGTPRHAPRTPKLVIGRCDLFAGIAVSDSPAGSETPSYEPWHLAHRRDPSTISTRHRAA